MKSVLPIFFFSWISLTGFSQSILDTRIEDVSGELSLKNFLIDFEKDRKVKFFFLDEWLEPFTITPTENGKTLQEALTSILGTEVTFSLMFDYAIIFSIDSKKFLHRQEIIENALTKKSDVDEIVIGVKGRKPITKNVTIRGTIKNKSNNAPLQGVTIELEDGRLVVTNEYGNYEITIPRGENVVMYSISNYRERVVVLKAYEDGILSFALEEMPTVLQEVVVTDQAVLNNRIGQTSIKVSEIKRAPTFLGEADLIKSIQSQAGVTTVGEIASGFNVRGGGVDQNLVLYEGVPVFNTSHALGLFTSFNSAAIKNVSFFRGGIPAKYGGRASAVLNIDAAEGNPNTWGVSGNVGIISSELTLLGPIKKDTTLFAASFRSSYSDWILDIVKSKYNLRNSSLSFYDASVKLTHKLNRTTKVSFSGYTSSDQFKLINDTSYTTRNVAASLRVDKTLSEELIGSVVLGFGQYVYTLKEEDPATAFDLKYGIAYPSLNFDFDYSGKHKLTFGLHNTLYIFNPGILKPQSDESSTKDISMDRERSLESALYLSDELHINEKLFVEVGLRYSLFNNFGPSMVYKYAPGQPYETQNIVDSTQYHKHQIVKTYHGLEPRISVRYSAGQNASIKFGYNRMYQYLHMISNTAATAPVDIWQSGNTYFRPQVADQISIGYYKNLNESMYEAFTEVFYKKVENVLDFKDGADLILNKNIEAALLRGEAHSYGVEFSISKRQGKLIASGNYTFSRSLRRVNGFHDSEKINDGEWYPSNYDQPHVLNFNWQYGITRRVFFSGNFSYRTGRPMSLPEGAYVVDGVPISDFPDRNKYRIPDYHRMDIALVVEGNHKLKKLWDGAWVFSFYNVYARRNAYAVFFKGDGNDHMRPYKLSVIGSIIPSITYRFKF